MDRIDAYLTAEDIPAEQPIKRYRFTIYTHTADLHITQYCRADDIRDYMRQWNIDNFPFRMVCNGEAAS